MLLIKSLNEYQELALKTADYPDIGKNIVYPALGLSGEAGEAADKVKKWWRNHGITDANNYTPEQKTELAKELGDALWYVAAAAKELGYPLGVIAGLNIEKLQDRKLRSVIKSEGDNR